MCDTDKPHFPLKRKTHFFLFFSTCFEKFLDCWMSSEAKSRSMTRFCGVPWRSVEFYDVLWSPMEFYNVLWRDLTAFVFAPLPNVKTEFGNSAFKLIFFTFIKERKSLALNIGCCLKSEEIERKIKFVFLLCSAVNVLLEGYLP